MPFNTRSTSRPPIMLRFYTIVLITCLIRCVRSGDSDEECSSRDRCSDNAASTWWSYRDQSPFLSRNCFCDSRCEQYGDCCERPGSRNDRDDCVDFLSPALAGQSSEQRNLFVWMRTTCLSTYVGSDADHLCRNLRNESFQDNPAVFLPVSSSQTNITYRNYYCAHCNDDANDEIQFWIYEVVCRRKKFNKTRISPATDEEMKHYQNKTRHCTRKIHYPHGHNLEPSVFIRPCKPTQPSQCPADTSPELARNCSLSATAYRYLVDSSSIYRNVYCARCNQADTSNLTCSDPSGPLFLFGLGRSASPSLSILFNPAHLNRRLKKSVAPIAFSTTRYIILIVCTSISLCCLLVFVIVFCRIPSLQNIPGQCLLALFISLSIGQLLLTCSSHLRRYALACSVSAVLTHYCYLSSFVWLLVLSIQIHSTFNRPTSHQDQRKRKSSPIMICSIAVFCSTATVVSIAAAIQWISPQSSLSPRYGVPHCFISNPTATIVFFLVPIGCLLFVVTVLFIKTVWAIHHARSTARFASATSTSSSHQAGIALVYARLASMMGIQWVLLIAALAIDQTWSSMIFEIINSLPGVFICLGLLGSKRLFAKARREMALSTAERHALSSNTTKTTTSALSTHSSSNR